MAQQVKHRAAKKDDPSSIPQDLRDRERADSHKLFSDLRMNTHGHAHKIS